MMMIMRVNYINFYTCGLVNVVVIRLIRQFIPNR